MAQGDVYDLVVLGGGPGGYATAFRASLLGLKVAMVERDKVGGTCLHRGCIPTKGLLHAAEIYETIQEAKAYGINAGQPEVDWAAVQAAKDEPVRKLHAGLASVVKHRKVDLVQGNGTLGDRGTVVVDGREVRGRNVVIAAGSFARTLPGMDADGERIVTSDHALRSERLPRSIAVIGAGAVGVEFASIYRSFGCEVALVEALPRIVPLEDQDISKELTAAFAKRGIAVHAGAKVAGVDTRKDLAKVTFEAKGKAQTIEVETVLIAVGRGPATDGLDLERWGIRSERGFVVTDDHLRAADGVWAVGDCVGGAPQLAHAAFAMGFFVAEQIGGGRPVPVDFDREVAAATYCVPEIASIGFTEEQAKERGHDVITAKHSFAGIAKAQILHQPRGFVKMVAERDGTVLGVHMIGPRVTENIAEALLAVGWEAMPKDMAALVHPHPTLSEGIGEAALASVGRPLHG